MRHLSPWQARSICRHFTANVQQRIELPQRDNLAAIGAERTLVTPARPLMGRSVIVAHRAVWPFSCDQAAESTIAWRNHSQIECGAVV
jgi:hypothetical protein